MLDTLQEVLDSRLLDSVHARLRQILTRKRDEPVPYCFPLPKSVDADDLERLQRYGRSMIALPKDDGTRVLLLCMTAYNQPRVFLITRNGATFHLIVQARSSALAKDTLLDCELCQLRFEADRHVVHVMDAHMINGKGVHRDTFVNRMRAAQQWLDAGQLSAKAANVEVRVKEWVWARDCLRHYQQEWSHEAKYGLCVDGVIFVCNDDEPQCTRRMFKWKPQEKHTVDLLTVESTSNASYSLYAQDKFQQHALITPTMGVRAGEIAPHRRRDFAEQDMVQFSVNIDPTSPSYLMPPSEPGKPMSSAIVEYSMRVDPATATVTLKAVAQRSNEKAHPNSLRVVARTIFNWLDGLTLRQVVSAILARPVNCPDHLRSLVSRQHPTATSSCWPGGLIPNPDNSKLLSNLDGIIDAVAPKPPPPAEPAVQSLLSDLNSMLDTPPPPPPHADISQIGPLLDSLSSALDNSGPQASGYNAGQSSAFQPAGMGLFGGDPVAPPVYQSSGYGDFEPPLGAGPGDRGHPAGRLPALPSFCARPGTDRRPRPRHDPSRRPRAAGHRRERHRPGRPDRPAATGRIAKRPDAHRADPPVQPAGPAVFEFIDF